MWRNSKHPMWPILRSLSMFAGAALLLHVTASHFDAGELKAATGVGVASFVFDLIKRSLANT